MWSQSVTEKFLSKLNDRLNQKGLRVEIFVFHGVVLCVTIVDKFNSLDVDALFEHREELERIAEDMEDECSLHDGWITDCVWRLIREYESKGKFNGATDPFYELSNLRIFTSRIDYLLALRVVTARVGKEYKDVKNIKFILEYLGVRDFDSAYRIVLNYFPEHLIPARSRYLLMELLG